MKKMYWMIWKMDSHLTLDIFRKEVQNNGIENEFYACPVV